jgi:anti-sigma factor RsiW
MNRQTALSGPHLDDGELVRYLDAEGTAEEGRRWDEHLGACPRCWGEAETLRNNSRALSRWLAAADFDTTAAAAAPAAAAPAARPGRRGAWHRARRGSGPWLKAAVITLLLAAPLTALPPVREWIAHQVASMRADEPVVIQPAQAPASGEAQAGLIRFVPAPGSFRVVVDEPQAEGFLRVGRTAGPEAVLEIRGVGARPEPVVSARGIRIANSREATTSYTLSLPPEVDAVSVDIGGQRVHLDGRNLSQPLTISLRRPAQGEREIGLR